MKRTPPIRIFVSYSHSDRNWFEKLRPLLKFSPPAEVAHVWHDQELKAGDQWEKEIRSELAQMDIFLCMVSYNFLASDFIGDVEMTKAIERERESKTIIVPLFICDMAERDVGHLKPFNPLPAWGRSWRSYEKDGGHTMDAHKPIRDGLWEAIDKAKEIRDKIRNATALG
jgi:hypothetical protein